jgi:hypothetical protein
MPYQKLSQLLQDQQQFQPGTSRPKNTGKRNLKSNKQQQPLLLPCFNMTQPTRSIVLYKLSDCLAPILPSASATTVTSGHATTAAIAEPSNPLHSTSGHVLPDLLTAWIDLSLATMPSVTLWAFDMCMPLLVTTILLCEQTGRMRIQRSDTCTVEDDLDIAAGHQGQPLRKLTTSLMVVLERQAS